MVSEEQGREKDELEAVPAALRQRAEELLNAADARLTPDAAGELNTEEVLRLVHELQVHQVELEMQNDELRRAQVALQAMRDRYALLYDRAPVGYLTLDLTGKVIHVNETAAELLGRERFWFPGRVFPHLVHTDDRVRFHYFWREVLSSKTTSVAEVRVSASNNSYLWARLHASMDDGENEQAQVCRLILTDVTERRRAEELIKGMNEELEHRVRLRTNELTQVNEKLHHEISAREQVEVQLRRHEQELETRVAERTHELAMLLAVARNLGSTLQIEQLLDIILDQLQLIVEYTGCAVYELNRETLTVVAYRGPLPHEQALQSQLALRGSVALAMVVETRQPVIIPDLHGDADLAKAVRERGSRAEHELIGAARSWMAVPLIAKDEIIALLRLDHVEPHHFTAHHAQMALTVATQAAAALENAALYRKAWDVAAMEERQRLARELHDSVAQTFYAIALAANSTQVMLTNDMPGAHETLEYIASLSDTGLTEMRALIFDLQPEALSREGLVAALARQTAALRARNDMRVDEDLCDEPDAPIEVKEVVYRIAQEAMRNIVRHAGARQVTLVLKCDDEVMHLEVRDDGVGFDPDRVSDLSMGLRSMRERALSLGGKWGVESAPQQGTRVWTEIPLRGAGTES